MRNTLKRSRFIFLAVVISVSLIVIFLASTYPAKVSTQTLMNRTYITAWGANEPCEMQFVQGEAILFSESCSKAPGVIKSRVIDTAIGDITNDGADDAFVILENDGGGSGHFVEMLILIVSLTSVDGKIIENKPTLWGDDDTKTG